MAMDRVRCHPLLLLARAGSLSPCHPPTSTTPRSASLPSGTRTFSRDSPRTGTRTRTSDRPSISGFSISFPEPHRSSTTVECYLTLSFIPTLGTMILGLIAGSGSSPRLAADPLSPDAHRRHRSGGRSCTAFISSALIPSSNASDPGMDALQRRHLAFTSSPPSPGASTKKAIAGWPSPSSSSV